MSGILDDFKSEAKNILLDALKSIETYKSKPDSTLLYKELCSCFYGLQGGANLLQLNILQKKAKEVYDSLDVNKEKDDFNDQDLDRLEKDIVLCIDLLKNPKKLDLDTSENLKELQLESQENPLIYIVEDEKFMQELLESIAAGEEYRVKLFNDGEAAIQAFKESKPEEYPNCILTDLTMPFKSGLQLIQEIQEIDPYLPVIFISGDVVKDTVIQAVNYGVFGIIEKPFRPEHVISVLNNAVKRSKLSSLLDKSINLLTYQLANIDQILTEYGREGELEVIQNQIQNIVEKRKRLFKVEQNKRIKLF